MDRLDAMKVFVTALDQGSLTGAGQKLGKSPAAISRAIAFLEGHVGAELLHRTTRSIKLSEAGERYAVACRRILMDLDEADVIAAGERSAPRGTLTISAPVAAGEDLIRPIIDDFMDMYPAVRVRLVLLDRPAHLIEEGIDLALRIAHLADSTLIAIRLGEVRRVLTASPAYLARFPALTEPADLAQHQIIAMSHFGIESWSFPPLPGSSIARMIPLTPRFIVNSIRGAVSSAIEGHGVTRTFSYHVADHVLNGLLQPVLTGDEHAPLPVHLMAPNGRMQVPKVRSFVDFAVPKLKAYFAQHMRACPSQRLVTESMSAK